MHIGKLDHMFWALSESFNALGDYFNRFGVYLIYMSTYSQSGNWFVYIIRCADSTLYTGISTNVTRRFEEHASSSPRSAKYLRGRAPLELIYAKEIGTQSEATIEERRIKALTKVQKLNLVAGVT